MFYDAGVYGYWVCKMYGYAGAWFAFVPEIRQPADEEPKNPAPNGAADIIAQGVTTVKPWVTKGILSQPRGRIFV